MSTQPIVNSKNSKKETLKNAATMAGAAVAGAGTAFAAEAIMTDEPVSDQDIVQPTVVSTEEQPAEETVQQESAAGETTETGASHAGGAQASDEHGPQEGGEEQHAEPVEPAHTPEPSNVSEPTTTPTTEPTAATSSGDIDGIPDVDPQLVAQEVVSGEYVDPSDIDAQNVPIAAVGTVETVDGEVLNAAQFIGDSGEQLYMIDVDGDHQYDLIADASGNVLGEVPGTMTVSDSENLLAQNAGEGGYMAHTDSDNTPDDIAGDIDQDIQTV